MGDREKEANLADLGLTAIGGRETVVTGLAVDSRNVQDGFLFAALPGVNMHGADFISYAVRMGANAILTDREGASIAGDVIAEADLPLVLAEDPRQALAYAAALWFGTQPETVVAVTGTNGKTSVATFLRQIWALLGFKAANIGTTGVEGAMQMDSPHTTPEPITLHQMLMQLDDAGVSHVSIEASSHGLAQHRLDGVQLAAAGFSNFSQDHLDYHADFEEYFEAKARLFSEVLADDGAVVLNADDARALALSDIAQERGLDLLKVGRKPGTDMHIRALRMNPTGQTLRFDWQNEAFQVELPLIGGFQAENVLLAAGLAIVCGADPARVFDVMHQIQPVRGRMQLAAERSNGATVFVDYAHTPDAIGAALSALRPHVMGRLVAVIGAGGDRDKLKRKLMGAAAAENADLVFVTDDNPRTEDPAAIRAMVMQGCPEATEIGDRAEAILRAVDALGPGDALLIAGKGHETGQIIGEDVFPFDDVEQASVAVAALDGHLA